LSCAMMSSRPGMIPITLQFSMGSCVIESAGSSLFARALVDFAAISRSRDMVNETSVP
jgi:hypothetical protein